MSWIYLIVAGIFEVVWAPMMKMSEGFSILGYSIATIIGMMLSFGGLILATKHLQLSIAYPIWTGDSIMVGIVLFHDHFSPVTWIFIVLLVISIIGIKLTTSH